MGKLTLKTETFFRYVWVTKSDHFFIHILKTRNARFVKAYLRYKVESFFGKLSSRTATLRWFAYLIFVIFLHRHNFWFNIFYTKVGKLQTIDLKRKQCKFYFWSWSFQKCGSYWALNLFNGGYCCSRSTDFEILGPSPKIR